MISSLLFEEPIALATICIGGEFLLLWVWSRRRTRLAAQAMWMGAVAAIVLPGLSLAVVTPREQIIQTCRELGKAVDEGDMEVISARFSPSFSTDGWDRDELVRRAIRALTRVRVDQVRLRHFEIDFLDKQQATATFDATCNVRTTDGFAGTLPSRWELSFRKVGTQWVVSALKSIPVPPFQITRLDDWLR